MGLLKEYKSSLKLIEVEEILELYFYRPLAFLLVKLVYPTTITPNQITIFSLSFGVAGGIALGYGTRKSMLLSALFFLLFEIFDCADGQLARLKGNGSQFGRILDGIADYIVSAAAYIGLGIGFANNSSKPLLYWVLIIIAAISNIFYGVLVDFYKTRFIDYTQDTGDVLGDELDAFRKEYEDLKKQKGKYIEKFVIGIYLKYSSLQGDVTNTNSNQKKISQEVYYRKNRLLIHLWTYLGPATLWTFLIICVLLNRLDIYLWSMVIVFNLYAILLYLIQKKYDKDLGLQ